MREKIKKNKGAVLILLLIAIIASIVAGVVLYQKYKQQEKDVAVCKERCIYNTANKVWEFGQGGRLYRRDFPKQEQCIDYCVNN